MAPTVNGPPFELFASSDDVRRGHADLSAQQAAAAEAVSARLDRALRRMVLALSVLMIGAGAVVVLVVRLAFPHFS